MIETLIAGLTCGIATYYGLGDGFHGQTTANGERFDAYRWTAAHPYLPMGTRIRVTNQVTSFQGKEMSERLISKRDMEYGADSRINEYGYEVTKFHTSPHST